MADALCRLPRVLLDGRPAARALLCGSNAHPGLRGEALFYPYQDGTLLLIRALGLPGTAFMPATFTRSATAAPGRRGLHCAGPHYDPEGREHPEPRGRSPSCSPAAAGRSPSCIPADFSRAGAGPVGGTPRSAR